MTSYLAATGSLPAVVANKPPEWCVAGRMRSQRTRFAPSASAAGAWWTGRRSFTSTTTSCEKLNVLLDPSEGTPGGITPPPNNQGANG